MPSNVGSLHPTLNVFLNIILELHVVLTRIIILAVTKVQAVVYTTRSIHEVENENVVSKAVEYTNLVQQRRYPYRVAPPVIPFSSEAIDNNIGIHGKFIKFRPTEKTSGCFIAVVTREVCCN